MKKLVCIFTIVCALLLTTQKADAQAWGRDVQVLSIGIGSSNFFHIDDYYYEGRPRAYRWYAHTTGQFNFQGEFAVHEYVGLGFTTGFGGRGPKFRRDRDGELTYRYAGELNMPVGMIANFHFYQLIANRSSRDIKADRLDIYTGANIGTGVALIYYEDVTRVAPLAFGGMQVGLRYYFSETAGINAEFGWGKSVVNLGFSFKM